jgi:hypothetical protein
MGVYEDLVMKTVYTNENVFMVSNGENLIEAQKYLHLSKINFRRAGVQISSLIFSHKFGLIMTKTLILLYRIVKSHRTVVTMRTGFSRNCSEKNSPLFEICYKMILEKLKHS